MKGPRFQGPQPSKLNADGSNGNLTEDRISNVTPKPKTKRTYDAWNRLVKAEEVFGIPLVTKTVGEYEHNGLNWRTVKRSRIQELDGVATIWYYATDTIFSVRAVLDQDGVIYERIKLRRAL